MFALLLGAVIWILFSPPVLADGGNRIRNVQPINNPILWDYPWEDVLLSHSTSPCRIAPNIYNGNNGDEGHTIINIIRAITNQTFIFPSYWKVITPGNETRDIHISILRN